MRVLIVDDDEQIRTALQRSLVRLGYDVLIAANGEAGLAIATESSPAVVLVDLRMSGMDGHTFARRARAMGLPASLIVMSGHGEMDDVIDAVRNGAVDYLRKPWSLADLSTAVARAVDLFETRSAPRVADTTPMDRPLAAVPVDSANRPSPPITQVGPGPRAAPTEGAASFASILKRVQAGELLLPAIPSVIGELRALVQRPESTLDDVVALIERDQKMTAQLMRLANTLQHSRGVPSKDIKTAVSRVGLRRVQALAETAAANDLCPIQDPAAAGLRVKLWTYSLARALAMRGLAEAAPRRTVDPETAYLVGLFADVGASFLLWAAAERTPVPPIADCVTLIRDHHATVGNLVLARWGVEREMTMLARLHHAPALPEPRDPYCTLEVVAASLAEQLVPDGDVTSRGPRPETLLRDCNAALGVSAVAQQSLVARLAPELAQMLVALAA